MAEVLTTDDVAATVEGVIEEWFPGYVYVGPGNDDDRSYFVVNITRPGSDEHVYEVRDHLHGQDIVGRYRVKVQVEKIGG